MTLPIHVNPYRGAKYMSHVDPKKIRIAIAGMGVSVKLAAKAFDALSKSGMRLENHRFPVKRITLNETTDIQKALALLKTKMSEPPPSYFPAKKRGKGKWKKY